MDPGGGKIDEEIGISRFILTQAHLAAIRELWPYDAAGNVIQVNDNTGVAGYRNYTYDSLDRLSTAYPTGGGNDESYSYNTIGNITSATWGGATKTYCYSDSAHKHAVTSVAGGSCPSDYTYDANGNMTGNGRTIGWTVENKPSQVISGTVTVNFTYNGDGIMVKKEVVGGDTTVYVGGIYEKNVTTGEITKYYYQGPKRIAMRKGSNVYYILSNHLGSSATTVNPDGTSPKNLVYYPFGQTKQMDSGFATDKRFTGQELMESVGLYNYGARLYDPLIARFISADTVVPNPRDPQTINRYSYVNNNPVKYTDPTGHFCVPCVAVPALAVARQVASSPQARGAAWSVGGYVAGSQLSGKEVTFEGLVAAAWTGAIAGPMTSEMSAGKGPVGSAVTSAAIGAGANVAQYTLEKSLTDKSLDNWDGGEAGTNAFLGAVSGGSSGLPVLGLGDTGGAGQGIRGLVQGGTGVVKTFAENTLSNISLDPGQLLSSFSDSVGSFFSPPSADTDASMVDPDVGAEQDYSWLCAECDYF